MISATIMYIIAIVMGLVGGLVHQLHDSHQPNNKLDIIRGIVMGAIAGLLTVAISPIYNINALVVTTFIVGWFGDSVVLNILRRGAK